MLSRLSFNILAISLVFSFFVTIEPAWATLFRNAYISFELPPNWECKLDGTEWVCVSQYAKQAKEAIIILAAKELGPTDNLAAYLTHLKTPRDLTDKSGKVVPSKVLHVKERLIASHPWVDGLHSGSEVPSYYTRYLATVKDRLAILVTFSSHKDHYTKYVNDFLKAIESLRVVASKDILDGAHSGGISGGGSETIGVPIADMGQGGDGAVALPDEPTIANMKTKVLALALLLGAIGIILWRRKK